MITPDGRRIHGAVVALATGAGALASQLPGLAFFTDYSPPYFGPLTLMTGGLTLAVFIWVFSSLKMKAASSRLGIVAVSASVVLAIIYISLLNWVTVPAPPETGIVQRFQIGFGFARFSLTPEGLKLLDTMPDITPEFAMLAKGAFRPGGTQLIWKAWTITASWLMLSCVFFLAYLAWSFGLACIALRLTGHSQSRTRA
jgi:hypothetical protein